MLTSTGATQGKPTPPGLERHNQRQEGEGGHPQKITSREAAVKAKKKKKVNERYISTLTPEDCTIPALKGRATSG